MGEKYEQTYAGEWVPIVKNGWHVSCCDCGLVHRFDFRIVNGRLEMRAYRENGATGQVRRWLKKKRRGLWAKKGAKKGA